MELGPLERSPSLEEGNVFLCVMFSSSENLESICARVFALISFLEKGKRPEAAGQICLRAQA